MKDNGIPSTVDEYISLFPEPVREKLRNIRSVIQRSAPGATECISYRMPAYKMNGVLVYFAAYDKHIGFYPTSSGVEAFRDELAGFHTSKGTVQFPHDRPVPYELIGEIVRFRAEENRQKGKRSKSLK